MFLLKAIILFAYFIRMFVLQKTVYRKVEYSFHISLNNHKRDTKILTPSKHANILTVGTMSYKENSYQLNNIEHTSTEVLKQRLKDKEKY